MAHTREIFPRGWAGRNLVRPDPQHRGAHANTVARQQLGADRAGRHPRRGFSGGGSLEHVAHVRQLIGGRTSGVVGMARTRPRHRSLGGLLGIHLPGIHGCRPVLPVEVAHPENQRRAQSPAVAETAADLDLVLFDTLPAAAAESMLATTKPVVDLLSIDLETGRQSFEDGGQTGAVAFSAGEQTQSSHKAPSRHRYLST